MTKVQATNLLEDWGKGLKPKDYDQHIYVSIRGVGSKVFRNCAYHETDGYTFIWTKQEKYILNKKEVGDFIIVPFDHSSHVTLKKVT